ncbi:small integral membrane protein 27 [Lepidochelys kempii]
MKAACRRPGPESDQLHTETAGPQARQTPRKGCWDRKRLGRSSTAYNNAPSAACKWAERRPRDRSGPPSWLRAASPGDASQPAHAARFAQGWRFQAPTKDGGSERAPVSLCLHGDLPLPCPTHAPLPARTMAALGRSARDWLYSLILLTIVLLSWGYVIYATRIAARWQLEKDYPDQMLNF